jgi:hypothetical protein
MITSPSRDDLAITFVHLYKADVPVEVVNVSTAGTAQRMKALQNEEICDGRYAVDIYKLRSIEPSPRAMKVVNTARKKVLQNATLRAVRAVL